MDEARRFLRYVMPGLVYGVETLLLLWIANPQWTQYVVGSFINQDNAGTILGSLLLAFGALGYIFAAIHHVCHWWCNERCDANDRILDHRSIEPYGNKHPKEAMAASYAEWYMLMNRGKIGADGNNKVGSLGDQAHGLGAASFASAFALATATFVICITNAYHLGGMLTIYFITMLLVGVGITCLFNIGYRRVGEIAHLTYEKILITARESSAEPYCKVICPIRRVV